MAGFTDDPFTTVEMTTEAVRTMLDVVDVDRPQEDVPDDADNHVAQLEAAGILVRRHTDVPDRPGNSQNRNADWLPAERSAPYLDIAITRPDVAYLFQRVQERTYVTPATILASIRALEYVNANTLGGDVVECGVWRGGWLRAMAEALGPTSHRSLWGYDTFSATWEPPTTDDHLITNPDVDLQVAEEFGDASDGLVSLASVRSYLLEGSLPESRLRLIAGFVQETLQQTTPAQIAILHLDTDLYDSTKVELEVLYPRVVTGGVVIIDDYGKWAGATRAVDEFLERLDHMPLLQRLERQGCQFVKP
ncbi:TylF/MycF/NovP-related O-methyltransferase [Curtobacterium sp. MCLR17_032]|uniref:TylF/MycF/NovP-related O-methyltransferase n=1 Tax=Curtobacterium sp. MCLR17_032 TaxID=2175650 RepID=UPI0015E8E4D8|nr:TylF/MycF/NovP-related O-methyltransferase [Curtobacterium sp. MCLR17_032]WIE61437.1 TylF/MycF/NovP-related O-methyltransferase [Curtobacterium sp. MCLR17_032]